MGSRNYKALILEYFDTSGGRSVFLQDLVDMIADENGVEPTAGGVQQAVSTLIKEGHKIDVLTRGNCWRYNGPPEVKEDKSTTRKIFELLAETREGLMVLESEDNEVIVVKPVQFS